MIGLDQLPALNAALNATSALLLVAGWVSIRRRAVAVHKALMLSAFAVSTVFLASYLVYHFYRGSTPFQGHGLIRGVYFAVLISHIILAAVNLPMVVVTLTRALRQRFDAHRRLARITFPVWLYVSVTGVVVYFMLYHLN
ncbi:MAG: DUF420 domain-containing protein [Phycisphaerae bacterium]